MTINAVQPIAPTPETTIRRALVTGANGFIAGVLTQKLLASGVTVRALCRDPRKGAALAAAGADVIAGDVQDAARLTEQTRGCDVVFNVAATFNTSPAVHYRVNVGGALNVAQAAQAAGVTRLIHVSTVGVYGLALAGRIGEAYPQHPSPNSFYQQSKKIGEDELWRYAAQSGLPVTVIRPAMVYGPGSGFWSGTIYDLCKKLPFLPGLTGNAHPIYIDDVVGQMIIQAEHPAAVGEAFNSAPDPAVTWIDYIGGYARLAGRDDFRKLPLRAFTPLLKGIDAWLRFRGAPEDISGTVNYVMQDEPPITYAMDRARDLLGWVPRVSFSDGMAATAAWLKARENEQKKEPA